MYYWGRYVITINNESDIKAHVHDQVYPRVKLHSRLPLNRTSVKASFTTLIIVKLDSVA